MSAVMVTKSFLISADEAEAARTAALREGVGLAEFYRAAIAARVAGAGMSTGGSPESKARDEALMALGAKLEDSIAFATRTLGAAVAGAVAELDRATKERAAGDQKNLDRFKEAAQIVHNLNTGLTRSLARAGGMQP